MRSESAVASRPVLHLGLFVATLGYGFRHGFDWDHLAAITDICGSQEDRRRSLGLATFYALGHAVVVLALGLAAIFFAARLPAGLDETMERLVGVTLVVLGCWVLYGLARHGRAFRPRSAGMLLFGGIHRALHALRARPDAREDAEILHTHLHRTVDLDSASLLDAVAPAGVVVASGAHSGGHVASPPQHAGHRHARPFDGYAGHTSFGVGMIHGVGAETPTQLLVFVTAAGASGRAAGVLLLLTFLTGLVAANTAVAVMATLGLAGAGERWWLFQLVSVTAGLVSVVIGAALLTGAGGGLPAFPGGV